MSDTDVAAREAETRRAEQARAILDNPLWGEVKAQIDRGIMVELTKAAINDHQQLVHLKLFKQAIDAFEASLERTATTGKLAAESLRRHYSAIEKITERFKRKG